jgi:low affinity Fe/Cu permease
MLVLIQHTQNHDDEAVQLKLDELIRANPEASNDMMRLEDASQSDLARIREAFTNEVSD